MPRTNPLRRGGPDRADSSGGDANGGDASGGDAGSAGIWVLTTTALLGVLAVVVVLRSTAVLARHRSETAADLAALAAATQIGASDQLCGVARAIARANGAELISCTQSLDRSARSGSVTVDVGVSVWLPIVGSQTVRASARAGRAPPPS